MNLSIDQKKAIVDIWSFLHQPARFNKTTFKRNGNQKVTELPNSLQIHAKKHSEIVQLGLQKKSKLSDEKAYLLGIKMLLQYLYDGIRKKSCIYEMNSTEKRTRFLFKYNENLVVIVLDHNRYSKYKREVSAVTCYYKIY
jgi:hypothetical protein